MIKATLHTIPPKSSKLGNSVIVTMSKPHDFGNIYNRLIGVPERHDTAARRWIEPGTRIFIYYMQHGIQKIVTALDYPFLSQEVIPEWKDGLPERYPVRVRTKFKHQSRSRIVDFSRLKTLGVRHAGTNTLIVPFHLTNCIMPISDEAGDKIEEELP